jgi:hypothetical protein
LRCEGKGSCSGDCGGGEGGCVGGAEGGGGCGAVGECAVAVVLEAGRMREGEGSEREEKREKRGGVTETHFDHNKYAAPREIGSYEKSQTYIYDDALYIYPIVVVAVARISTSYASKYKSESSVHQRQRCKIQYCMHKLSSSRFVWWDEG